MNDEPTVCQAGRCTWLLKYTSIPHGIAVIEKGKNIVLAEPEYIKTLQKKNIAHVLVVLRSPAEASKGFIKGGASIPIEKLSVA